MLAGIDDVDSAGGEAMSTPRPNPELTLMKRPSADEIVALFERISGTSSDRGRAEIIAQRQR